jgi:hypothetical protein
LSIMTKSFPAPFILIKGSFMENSLVKGIGGPCFLSVESVKTLKEVNEG